jgi:hypothetical protein
MVGCRERRRCLLALAALAVVSMAASAPAHAAARATARGAGADRNVATSSAQGDAWISAEGDYLSRRKLVVACAATAQDWARALGAAGFRSDEADLYYGFSLIAQGEMHLSPYVCEGLRLGLLASTRSGNELQVAWSVDVLVHESVHMARFTFDEALTEACARAALPLELHRLYGLAYRSPELSRLTLAATLFRRTQGHAYQTGTCPAPTT